MLTGQTLFYIVFNLYHFTIQVFTGGIARWWGKRKAIIQNIENLDSQSAFEYCKALIEDGEYKYKGIINNDTSIWGKFPTWTALSFIILARKPKSDKIFWGNCQDAFSMARWLFKKYRRIHNKKLPMKLHIYVPVINLNLVHYLLEVNGEWIVSGEKKGWKIRKESKDNRASCILAGKVKDWVWLR